MSNSQSPKKTLFFIGARIIEVIKSSPYNRVCTLKLYESYCSTYEEISFSYISLALDWLFITSIVDINDTGELYLCN
ncbi:ABC-three component system middle component 6 [Vibrio fluvialis]|uniref:ABC-three component system middle component 6 n=1 Tax=Vibrio fluvialis TaxID=676 RepID=UPI003D7D764C